MSKGLKIMNALASLVANGQGKAKPKTAEEDDAVAINPKKGMKPAKVPKLPKVTLPDV